MQLLAGYHRERENIVRNGGQVLISATLHMMIVHPLYIVHQSIRATDIQMRAP